VKIPDLQKLKLDKLHLLYITGSRAAVEYVESQAQIKTRVDA
jgi:hypothetical protein